MPLNDPAALWAALMADVGHHNSAAWLDHFELRNIDASKQPAQATLAPRAAAPVDPGHAARFATPPRLERLGQHLSRLAATPVRVTLARAPTAADAAGQSANASANQRDASPAGGGSSGGGIDRRDALGLPIVRDAFEVFPDAILVDARRQPAVEPQTIEGSVQSEDETASQQD